jgi:hypothetical protein
MLAQTIMDGGSVQRNEEIARQQTENSRYGFMGGVEEQCHVVKQGLNGGHVPAALHFKVLECLTCLKALDYACQLIHRVTL